MYGYTTFYLSIHQLMGIWFVSTSWLLWIMLLWTFVCKFLCGHMPSILLGLFTFILLFLFIYLFIYIFGCVGRSFRAGAFSSCGERGATLHRGARASHYRGLSLRSTGSRRACSVVVAHGTSCSAACGIFPDQGSNPCPLHWQADSQPLRHQGSPLGLFTFKCC